MIDEFPGPISDDEFEENVAFSEVNVNIKSFCFLRIELQNEKLKKSNKNPIRTFVQQICKKAKTVKFSFGMTELSQ